MYEINLKNYLLVKICIVVVDMGVDVICLSNERGFVKKIYSTTVQLN